MNPFGLTIATVDKTVFKGQAVHVKIVAGDGSRGIEARHEPLFVLLKPGSDVQVTLVDGKRETYRLANGFFTCRDNLCRIVCLM